MRGLPSSAQTWGSSVDASLSQASTELAANHAANSYAQASIEALVANAATQGVARFHTDRVRIGTFDIKYQQDRVLTIPLKWDARGLNALLLVRGVMRSGQHWANGFTNAQDTGTFIEVGVQSQQGQKQVRSSIVPIVSIYGRPQYFGDIFEVFPVSYDEYAAGDVFLSVVPPVGFANVVDGTIPNSFLELSVTTIVL